MQNRAWRESIELLFTRRFGTFWLACLLSNIGTWAQQVAIAGRRDGFGAHKIGAGETFVHQK